jgi:restriction endonuclease S subunit
VISRSLFGGAFPARRLGDVVEFLDSMRRPVTESDRRPGPYPYYGANGQQGTIDDFLFNEPLVLLAEDGGHFDAPDRGISYRISGKTWVNNHAHVLRPKPQMNLAFLFRVLENYDVTPFVTGTTRGKLTQAGAAEIVVPVPPIPEQRWIAEVLDRAEALRAKRRAALAQLDTLTQAIFLDMFGDPITNPREWQQENLETYFHFCTGKLDSNAAVPGGEFPFFTCSQDDFRINTYACDCEALLLAGNNASADYSVKHYKGKFNAYQRTYVITLQNECNSYDYAQFVLIHRLAELKRMSKGTNTKYLTLELLKRIRVPVPPIQLQMEYARRVMAVNEIRISHHASLAQLDALFASLQHRAFRGEL